MRAEMRVRRVAGVAVLPVAALLGAACSGGGDGDDGALLAGTPSASATTATPTDSASPKEPRQSAKASRSPRASATASATRSASPDATRTRTSRPDPDPTRTKTKSPKPSASRTVVTITMGDNYFSPSSTTIRAGTYVRTVNRGDDGHTWTSGNPPNGGGAYDYAVDPGETSPLYRFTSPGTYNFYCEPHYSRLAGNMRGTITVTS